MTPIDPDIPQDDNWAAGGPPKGVRVRVPIAVAVIAVVALLGIWGGAQLKGDNASANVTTGAGTGRGNRQFPASGGPGNGQRGGGTFGTVESVNGDTVIIKDAQGQEKTITLDSSTTITKSATGSTSDITTGETIAVRGTTNSDGSTTAASVNIGNGGFGPGGFGGGGPGAGGPPPAASSQN